VLADWSYPEPDPPEPADWSEPEPASPEPLLADGSLLAPVSVGWLPASVVPVLPVLPEPPVAVESDPALGACEASPPPEPALAGALAGEMESDGVVCVDGASCTDQ
jgi:hypothetical protein